MPSFSERQTVVAYRVTFVLKAFSTSTCKYDIIVLRDTFFARKSITEHRLLICRVTVSLARMDVPAKSAPPHHVQVRAQAAVDGQQIACLAGWASVCQRCCFFCIQAWKLPFFQNATLDHSLLGDRVIGTMTVLAKSAPPEYRNVCAQAAVDGQQSACSVGLVLLFAKSTSELVLVIGLHVCFQTGFRGIQIHVP